MVCKRRQVISLVVSLIVFSMLFMSCSLPPSPIQATGTRTAIPTRTEPQTVVTTQAAIGPVVSTTGPDEGSCSIQSESRAVRSGVEPDWSKMEPLPCYDLTLDLSKADTGAFTGTEKLTYTNATQSSLPDLIFRLYPNAPALYGGRLSVSSARVNGAAVTPQVLLDDQTAFRLELPQTLQPGKSVIVNLNFNGQSPSNFGSNATYGIFNLDTAVPVLTLANWYPILADLQDGQWQYSLVSDIGDAVTSQTALFVVQIVAPTGWKIASTGVSASSSVQAGQETVTFVSGPVRDFMLAASPKFTPETKTWQGIEITHWRLPDTMTTAGALEITQDSMEIYTDRFGTYPFTEIDVVDVPLQNAGGVEYPGLVLIQDSLYTPNQEQYLKVVIAHEIAHQWWYSVVGNNVRTAPWQDEALATFSSFLYFQKYDPGYYQGMLRTFEQQVQSYEQNHTRNAVDQPVTAFQNNVNGYAILVYRKGGLFFASLRQRIGDHAFFDALHTYYANNMYKLAPPDALLSSFERSCDCDLSSFYKQWGVIP